MAQVLPPHFPSFLSGFLSQVVILSCGQAIYLILFIVSLRFLVTNPSKRRVFIGYIGYLFFVFAVSVINFVAILSTYQEVLSCLVAGVLNPLLCEAPTTSRSLAIKIALINHTTWAITSAADCLMFYRAIVIWQNNIFVSITLAIILLAEVVLGLVVDIVNSISLRKYVLAAIGLSASFDVIACSLIVVRLLLYRRSIQMLGSAHGQQYASLIAVFLESAALTSTTRIIWVGVRFDGSGGNDARWAGALAIVGSMIGPLLIIIRLAMSISINTARPPRSEIVFAKRRRSTSRTQAAALSGQSNTTSDATVRSFILGPNPDKDHFDRSGSPRSPSSSFFNFDRPRKQKSFSDIGSPLGAHEIELPVISEDRTSGTSKGGGGISSNNIESYS